MTTSLERHLQSFEISEFTRDEREFVAVTSTHGVFDDAAHFVVAHLAVGAKRLHDYREALNVSTHRRPQNDAM